MKVIRHYKHTPLEAKNSTITLGNFDGVHKGHKTIIEKVVSDAKLRNIPSAVLTFEPHPLSFFKRTGDNFRITEFRNKFQIIEKLGVNYLFTLDFDKKLASMTAEDFIKKVLVDGLEVKHIIVGHDFIFGKNRTGNAELLRELAKKYKYDFTQIDTITNQNNKNIAHKDIVHKDNAKKDNAKKDNDIEIYSSTNIRKYIKNGEIEKVTQKLGHYFVISGFVGEGEKRGRNLGVPTINLNLGEYIRPKFGIYVASVKIEEGGDFLPAAVNIGINPTFEIKKEVLEAYILDFEGDLYGKYVEVRLLKYLRPEIKFDDIEKLKSQMNIDIEVVNSYFINEPKIKDPAIKENENKANENTK